MCTRVNHIIQTKSNTTTQDYSLPQDLLKCSSAKGFPEPRLRWLDSLGNVIPASQTVANCFPHAVRQEVFDCDLILKLPVTRYMDGASYTCELSHEAYRDGPVTVDKSIVVHYPPTEVVMKGNKTDSTIHCTSKSKERFTLCLCLLLLNEFSLSNYKNLMNNESDKACLEIFYQIGCKRN